MMKTNCPSILSLLAVLSATHGHSATIETVIKTTSVIRDDIERKTFGSGVEFAVPHFTMLMETGPYAYGPATAAQQKFKSLNMGSMRFPNGTSGQLFMWDDPQNSHPISDANDPWAKWISQEQMLKFTSPATNYADGLNMERLYQANTWQYRDYNDAWKLKTVYQAPAQPGLLPTIDTVVLDKVAARAANWVQNNNGKLPHEHVEYWEVGNEDWIYWTGAQYGTIFDKFREKMVLKRSGIKLLAQGLSENFTTASGGTNTMENWIEGLKTSIASPATSVYAYSEHQYMSAAEYPSDTLAQRRIKQTQDMSARIAAGARTAALKTKLASSPLTSPWKIWVTEFNTHQKVNGVLDNPQDMGQALVIADWTGKMLEQNVERMFYHSMDHNKEFALMQYLHEGGTIQAPRVTPPGYAYSIYPQEFGKKMLSSVVGTTTYPNVQLTAPNGMNYKQLAVYSSIRQDSVNGDTLRVIVINRATTGVTTLNLKTENIAGARRMKNAPAKYTYRQLRSANLTDSNKNATDAVTWSAPAQYNSSEWGIIGAGLGPASVNLFIIPLQ